MAISWALALQSEAEIAPPPAALSSWCDRGKDRCPCAVSPQVVLYNSQCKTVHFSASHSYCIPHTHFRRKLSKGSSQPVRGDRRVYWIRRCFGQARMRRTTHN